MEFLDKLSNFKYVRFETARGFVQPKRKLHFSAKFHSIFGMFMNNVEIHQDTW